MCFQVILTSGYYAVFRVTLTAKELEGFYDGGIQITTDYEVTAIQFLLTYCLLALLEAIVSVGIYSMTDPELCPGFPYKATMQV